MADENVEELRKTVIETFRKGEWVKCMSACEELHKQFPDNVGIILKLGEIYVKASRMPLAIDTYQKGAEMYAADGNFLKAVGVYKIILKHAPDREDIKKRMEELCSPEKKEAKGGTLPEIPLLSELGKDELLEVVNSLNPLKFGMGEMICREGDEGDSIYIITRGAVKIFVEGVAAEKIEIATLSDGDCFGEVGFFGGGKRSASVMSLDDTDLLEIRKEDFKKIEEKHPKVRDTLENFYRRRVLDKLVAFSPLFSTLKKTGRQALLDRFKLKSFESGDVVIREGDEGDSLFIIKEGQVEVTTEDGDSKVVLAQLKEGEFFGEVSLMTGKARTATIKAVSPLEVMELSKKDLMELSGKYPKVKEVLDRYRKVRVKSTVDKIMALKDMEAKEGIL